jgi:aminomethyltransferase
MTDTELRDTPLTEEHARLGARLVPFAGYRMPVQYAGIKAEHQAVRTAAGLFDVSHMGELWLEGPNAVATADWLVTNDVSRLTDGQALYTLCCDAKGTILDDLIVYRLGPETVLIVCNAGNHDKIAAHFARETAGRCGYRDASDAKSLLALQGPKAVDVLRAAGAEACTSLEPFHVGDGKVGGASCLVARTGYTGEDGFEIFCANGDALGVFRTLLDVGKSFGLEPVGLGARRTTGNRSAVVPRMESRPVRSASRCSRASAKPRWPRAS